MIAIVNEDIESYAAAHSTGDTQYMKSVTESTLSSLDYPQMLTGPVEGRFLEMLVFALGARRILEIGTYSGYSALSMAAAMPEGGRIVTCELDDRHADVAQDHIDGSPYASMIEIARGPALETVAALEGPFDFVFIDADKENYPAYFEATLAKLAPGGLIAADNTLWSGRVADGRNTEASTEAIRRFNDLVVSDPRVVCVQLTVRDGVTLIRHAPRTDRGGNGSRTISG